MKKLRLVSLVLIITMFAALFAGCSSGSDSEGAADETVTITDMCGREVTIPVNPQRVYGDYTWVSALDPNRVIAFEEESIEEIQDYYPPELEGLPVLKYDENTFQLDIEGLLALNPDLIVNVVFGLDEQNYIDMWTQEADELQEQTGVPVVCISMDLKDTAESFRNLGKWLGLEERGNEVADFIQGQLDKATAVSSQVPDDEKPTFYYAEMSTGLVTEPANYTSGNCHVEPMIINGLKNVAELSEATGRGFEEVSMEQVIQWNPDMIFVYNQNAYEEITTESQWQVLDAVKNGKVYYCYSYPGSWYDRPPMILRVLGSLYVAQVAFPDYADYNLDDEVKAYFKTLYNVDLTDEQVQECYAMHSGRDIN